MVRTLSWQRKAAIPAGTAPVGDRGRGTRDPEGTQRKSAVRGASKFPERTPGFRYG